MKAYKNIIVPTDGSVNSKRALEHAIVLASSLGASITLVYVANIVCRLLLDSQCQRLCD